MAQIDKGFNVGDILRRRNVNRRVKAIYSHKGKIYVRLDYIPSVFGSETTITENEALTQWELTSAD